MVGTREICGRKAILTIYRLERSKLVLRYSVDSSDELECCIVKTRKRLHKLVQKDSPLVLQMHKMMAVYSSNG